MLPESESAKLVVMVVMVMIFIVVMLVMVMGKDRKKTGQPGQAGQTGQTDLTFKLEFPGNLCWASFAILAISYHCLQPLFKQVSLHSSLKEFQNWVIMIDETI